MLRPLLSLSVLAALGGVAHAQEASVPAEHLRPALDRDGLLGVESALIPPHLATSAVAWLGHGAAPVASFREGELVSGRIGGGVGVAIGVGRRAALSVDLPLVVYQWREWEPRNSGELASAGVGDLRLAVKFGLPTWQRGCVRFAGLVAATLPSGGRTSYLGEQGKTLAAELIAMREMGKHNRVVLNVGYHARPPSEVIDVEVDDDVVVRAGVGRRVPTVLGGPVDFQAALSARLAADDWMAGDRAVVELFGASAYQVKAPIDAFVGAGVGLTGGAGTPDWRLLLGLRYGFQLDVAGSGAYGAGR
jgi:hypothetical protein